MSRIGDFFSSLRVMYFGTRGTPKEDGNVQNIAKGTIGQTQKSSTSTKSITFSKITSSIASLPFYLFRKNANKSEDNSIKLTSLLALDESGLKSSDVVEEISQIIRQNPSLLTNDIKTKLLKYSEYQSLILYVALGNKDLHKAISPFHANHELKKEVKKVLDVFLTETPKEDAIIELLAKFTESYPLRALPVLTKQHLEDPKIIASFFKVLEKSDLQDDGTQDRIRNDDATQDRIRNIVFKMKAVRSDRIPGLSYVGQLKILKKNFINVIKSPLVDVRHSAFRRQIRKELEKDPQMLTLDLAEKLIKNPSYHRILYNNIIYRHEKLNKECMITTGDPSGTPPERPLTINDLSIFQKEALKTLEKLIKLENAPQTKER